MIRPSNVQKMGGKPPPPVPPRPSKTLVAEALAKTRQNNFKSPTRQAPPPPVTGANEIVKSKSSFAVNVTLKKPIFDRSISEELKSTSRPVVYQSTNVKCNKIQINKTNEESNVKSNSLNRENLRKLSDVREEKRRDNEQSSKRNSFAEGNTKTGVSEEKLRKRDSFSGINDRDNLCAGRDGFVERIVKIEDGFVEEDRHPFNTSKSNSSTLEKSCDSSTTSSSSSTSCDKKNWDQMLNDRNHVNTLIDEMFASVLDVPSDTSSDNSCCEKEKSDDGGSESVKISSDTDNRVVISNTQKEAVPTTVIVIKNGTAEVENKNSDSFGYDSVERGKQVKFDDKLNHELLIDELQCMKKDQEKILKRQRKPSLNLYENEGKVEENGEKHSDEEEKEENGHERLSSKMSLQHGLPPLPKSLSGFNLSNPGHPPTPPRSSSIRSGAQTPSHLSYPQHGGGKTMNDGGDSIKKTTTGLDAKLAILRQEMYSLRQLDLSLLSQLWSLNESIQEFRQMLQDQEDRVLSPPSPSPTPSSGDEEFYMSATSLNFRPAASSAIRKQSTSSNGSSMGG